LADSLRAFFLRIRAKRGHQIAAVALARKLAVICWHLLTKETEYLWQRPALVAHKDRSMELQAGQPMRKGNKRAPSHAYHIKELRDQEIEGATTPCSRCTPSASRRPGRSLTASAAATRSAI
jgi:transposase